MKGKLINHSRAIASAAFLSLLLVACNNSKPSAQQPTDTATVQPTVVSEEPTLEKPTVEVAKRYYGIDVSKWNGKEVSEIVPADSLTFVICKATQGLTGIDPDFKTNLAAIKKQGLISGAYHFYQVGDDPNTQAAHFWNTIGANGGIDIAPVVDIEQGSLPKGKANTTTIQKNLLVFLKALEKSCGKVPMIYTGAAFGEQYLNNPVFAKYPLWLAEYTQSSKPKVPKTWAKTGYKIWQRSDGYKINSTTTDFDVYFGTKSNLTK